MKKLILVVALIVGVIILGILVPIVAKLLCILAVSAFSLYGVVAFIRDYEIYPLPEREECPNKKGSLPFEYNDAGRDILGGAQDCVPRAIAIATGGNYRKIFEELQNLQREFYHLEVDGVNRKVSTHYLTNLGWKFKSSKERRLTKEFLQEVSPYGLVIVAMKGHFTVIKDGVILDMANPSGGIIHGYFYKN